MSTCLAGNLLYVGTDFSGSLLGGREQLSQLIRDSLQEIAVDGLEILELKKVRVSGSRAFSAIFLGHVDGVSSETIASVIVAINSKAIGTVLLDGSNLGSLAKAISRACPHVQVVTFFHNCEARFFLGAFRQAKTVRSFGILMANYFAERRAVRFSDKRICLNERDSGLLRRLYGRGATHISAMAMRDKLPPESADAPTMPPVKRYALFVGGAFYANQAGIAWFARNVSPHVSIKTCVVGKGLEAVRAELESHGNIEVLGEVEDLAPWYRDAHIVVAPIFDGSGMKTKVAEALMFGKRIIGTPEAFSGYEDHIEKVGVVCSTASEFIAAIEEEMKQDQTEQSSVLRQIFLDNYSLEAASQRLASIIKDALPGQGQVA